MTCQCLAERHLSISAWVIYLRMGEKSIFAWSFWTVLLHGCIFQHPNHTWGQEVWVANPLVPELVSGPRIGSWLIPWHPTLPNKASANPAANWKEKGYMSILVSARRRRHIRIYPSRQFHLALPDSTFHQRLLLQGWDRVTYFVPESTYFSVGTCRRIKYPWVPWYPKSGRVGFTPPDCPY